EVDRGDVERHRTEGVGAPPVDHEVVRAAIEVHLETADDRRPRHREVLADVLAAALTRVAYVEETVELRARGAHAHPAPHRDVEAEDGVGRPRPRSEERRVGKEWRSRGGPGQ